MDMEEYLKKVKESEIEDIGKYATILDNAIETYTVTDLNTFKTFLLPFINGSIVKTDENAAVYTGNVLSIAKSPRVEIRVMDGDDVKYIIPPLLLSLNGDSLKNINFNKLMNIYKDTSENGLAGIAIKNLSKHLDIVEGYVECDIKVVSRYIIALSDIVNDYPVNDIEGNVKVPVEEDVGDFFI